MNNNPLNIEYLKCHHGVDKRFHCQECDDEKNRFFNAISVADKEPPKRIPIYRGCGANGPCFCSGRCREVIGYRDPIYPGELLKPPY
jgi:hypothetical protein